MRITAHLTDRAIQFNLEPESDHERKFMAILEDYKGGEVTVHAGVHVEMCQGGYLREFGEKGLAITIERSKP